MNPRTPLLLTATFLLAAFSSGCHQPAAIQHQAASQSITIDAMCLTDWPSNFDYPPGFILQATGYESDLDAVWKSAQWISSLDPVPNAGSSEFQSPTELDTSKLKRLQTLGLPSCFTIYCGVKVSTPLIPVDAPRVPLAPGYFFLRMPGQRTGTAGVLFPILLRGSGPLPEELFFVHDLQELHQLVSINNFFLADPCIEGIPDRVIDSNGFTCWPPDIANAIKTIAARTPTPLIAPGSTPTAFPSLSEPR